MKDSMPQPKPTRIGAMRYQVEYSTAYRVGVFANSVASSALGCGIAIAVSHLLGVL